MSLVVKIITCTIWLVIVFIMLRFILIFTQKQSMRLFLKLLLQKLVTMILEIFRREVRASNLQFISTVQFIVVMVEQFYPNSM